ncbi:MAG: hypothetical protein KAI47_07640 [Deltaproteobacteria bacterium]|nr:hypothetical protein [Deltaproteobacteria bacterium]
MGALIALPLFGSSSCKKSSAAFDGAVVTPDAQLGAACDAEPNHWQIVDHGMVPGGDAGLRPNLFSIWGVDEHDMWTVGSQGTVLHWDGKAWVSEATPTDETLTSVWGTSKDDVFAVGFRGTLLRRQGGPGKKGTWETIPVPLEMFFETVPDAGLPTGDAAAVSVRNFWGVWAGRHGDVTQDVYIAGDRGTVLHLDVSATPPTWTRINTGVEEKLTGVWGANSSRVFVVGDFGTVLSGTQKGMSKMQTGVSKALRAVWGRRSNDVFAVGLSGVVLHYNGSKWVSIEGAPPQVLRGIWGPANDRMTTYLIGWDGVLLRMHGNNDEDATFDVFNCVSGNRLEAIWGTLVDGPWPDAGAPDVGLSDGGSSADLAIPQIPAIWIVGVDETVIKGP